MFLCPGTNSQTHPFTCAVIIALDCWFTSLSQMVLRQGYKMSCILEICVVSGLENNFSTLREYLSFSL